MTGAVRHRQAAGRVGRGILLIWFVTAALPLFSVVITPAEDKGSLFAQGLAAYDNGAFLTAFETWEPLAKQSHADAQVALAGLYISGRGMPQPSAEMAAHYYRQAALLGHAVGQLNLGEHYSRGVGVRHDLPQAYRWLSLAADQGRLWAAQRRDQIAVRMSKEEREQAERLLTAQGGDGPIN